MHRSFGIRFEKYTRMSGAQQHSQPAHTSSSSATRSPSVLGSLMRIRNQFHRLRHAQQRQAIAIVSARYRAQAVVWRPASTPLTAGQSAADDSVDEEERGDAADSNTSSALQNAIMLCTEALRLLNGEVRCKDHLSDVPPDSPAYGSEIGKLLTTAAAFGASTNFPRVTHALRWIQLNKERLLTPRQVMSLCMPLTSLPDGPTAGLAFVLHELYEPLLLALQEVAPTSPEPAGEPADGASSNAANSVQQHLIAITSAMGMVAKWSNLRLSGKMQESAAPSFSEVHTTAKSDAATEELEKMLRIAEACVVALRRQSGCCNRSNSDEAWAVMAPLSPPDVLQWIQCLHGLERMYLVAEPALGLSREQVEAASRRILTCYRALLPLVQRTLELAGGRGGAVAAGSSTASNGALTLGLAATSVRVSDLAELIQVGLQPSMEPTHGGLMLSYGLQALPGALTSATVKDLSDAVQVVNKVRQQRPSALPAALLLSIQAGIRPALFLLRETHALQLRASDCGVLLSSLSRWGEVPGVTVSADIVELLSQRFGEQVHGVSPSQLVPFVVSLARLEERHLQPQRDGASGEAVEGAAGLGENGTGDGAQRSALGDAWEPLGAAEDSSTLPPLRTPPCRVAAAAHYRFCTTSRVIAQCVQRAIALAGDSETKSESTAPPRLAAIDAAHLLASFVQLCAPQCVDFFSTVEPLLASAIRGNAESPSSTSEAIRLHVVAGDAVQRFARDAVRQCEPTSAQHSSPMNQETREEAAAVVVHRATALLAAMSRSLTKLVCDAASSKDLVLACSLLRRRLLGKRAAADAGMGGGGGALRYSKNSSLSTAAVRARVRASPRSWTRKEARLAAAFAAQAAKVVPKCRGTELATLASVTSSLFTAGALSRPAAQQFMRAVWVRCADGLAVAPSGAAAGSKAANALSLSVDNCKILMDASRSTRTLRTAPPLLFLEALAAQCGELLKEAGDSAEGEAFSEVARGTARAYAEAVSNLRRVSDLGRSLVSYFGSLRLPLGAAGEDAVIRSTPWREAFVSALESYLEVVHSVVEAYATEATLAETWWAERDGGSPPPMPLELLSTTAHVMAQIYRLARRGVGSTKLSSSVPETVPAVPDEVPNAEGDVMDGSFILDGAGETTPPELRGKVLEEDGETLPLTVASPETLSTATLDEAVRETLGLLGDTIAVLARQRQRLCVSLSAGMPEGSAADEKSGLLPAAPAAALMQNAKHLLMLLQAFEAVQYTHLDMLYSILPELRGCAERLDPLELSLLIRALTQLGAWNSRLLGALATAVASKMDQCELRQCYTLLRGLCRSGCISPETYVELRSSPHKDWDSGCGDASSKAAAQEPLQRLAENTLRRLDAFVRTRDAFMSLARTAAVAELVGVLNALRFFHAPPPATHDAFVVLAIRRLASQYQRLPLRTVIQHAITLLDAVSELRKPEQRCVSAQALWTVLRRAFALPIEAAAPGASAQAVGSALSGALHLHACWELTRFSAWHSLQYGQAATRSFFLPFAALTTERPGVSCASVTQARLGSLIEDHASDVAAGASSPTPPLTAADRAALRRYALHASPCLVRGDRQLDAYVRAPLKLARLIADGDPATLVHAATAAAAPAAQARRCIRMLACLLRSDLWTPSISATTPDAQLLAVALGRLWGVAGLDSLVCHTPDAFSREELLVLAAAADRAHRYSADAETLKKACTVAVCQLCTSTTEWRFPAAVDAWMLFATPLMARSPLPATSLPSCSDELFSMLVTSGDVLVTRFGHAQQSWATSGARVLPELLRLFLGPAQLNMALLHSVAADGDTSSVEFHSTAVGASAAQTRFAEIYKELLRLFTSCLAGTHGMVRG
ncbi:hypothetical protein LSCM1_00176 [Leishmania martiniquensis]|uniref:Uncharacterized protein n=1 Tax=Leishmania martiniquensis TaxID=1580590 RepID=A0A836GBH2_9TRYP|nr:hypothetical protein LSCM1_00176 [Leishmania martiniquensis]